MDFFEEHARTLVRNQDTVADLTELSLGPNVYSKGEDGTAYLSTEAVRFMVAAAAQGAITNPDGTSAILARLLATLLNLVQRAESLNE